MDTSRHPGSKGRSRLSRACFGDVKLENYTKFKACRKHWKGKYARILVGKPKETNFLPIPGGRYEDNIKMYPKVYKQ